MVGRLQRCCQNCGSDVGFAVDDNDGFYYCGFCNSRADDIVDTGVEENHFFSPSVFRTRVTIAKAIAAEPISAVKPTMSQYMDHPDAPANDAGDGVGLTWPSDFGSKKKNISYEDYYLEIRSRYLNGIQIMIQSQCKSLVEEFGVSPLIIGLVGTVWLRFLASTGLMAGEWADQAVRDSESQMKDEGKEFLPSTQHRGDPTNIHGKRVAYVWLRSLRSKIQLSCTLAISFLACHMARAEITPPDMIRWALEGKLPFFTVFDEIEKQMGSSSDACPIPAECMFRPVTIISSQKLESTAAQIGQIIGFQLPSVNFLGIASRFIKQLSLPVVDILPMASRMCEWSMPTELYLSDDESRIPTRACVMSILIVTIRMIFNINGCGMWESSFSNNREDADAGVGSPCNSLLPSSGTKLNVVELLRNLEARYNELDEPYEYSCHLPLYLKLCKDVVFSGFWPSYEDLEEEKLLKECWDFYQSNENTGKSDNRKADSWGPSGSNRKRCNDDSPSEQDKVKKIKSDQNTSPKSHTCRDGDQDSAHRGQPSEDSSPKDEAIRRLKIDMDDKKFCYVAPRVNVKSKDLLLYARKKRDVFVYAVHADYYILLRSCAKVARVETRVMHMAVLGLERRLQWMEKKLIQCCNSI